MNRPWMPLYVAEYRTDTAHLNAAQHGAYLLLIMHYWSTGVLPNDDAALARIACMTPSEWKRNRGVIAGFFSGDWTHKRVDHELAKASDISEKRRKAVSERGTKRQQPANNGASNDPSNDGANADQKQSNCRSHDPSNDDQKKTHAYRATQSQLQEQDVSEANASKTYSEANASDAGASIDHRQRLFSEGLKTLANLTGKGPDACRSFVGKCLKAAGDDAVTVLGLIEDAERNRVVDPSAWIAARLKGGQNGKAGIIQAADDLRRKIASFDGPGGEARELCGGPGEAVAGLLSQG